MGFRGGVLGVFGAGWGFTSFSDMFDGGGPGASGDSYTGGIHGSNTVGDATDGWQPSDLGFGGGGSDNDSGGGGGGSSNDGTWCCTAATNMACLPRRSRSYVAGTKNSQLSGRMATIPMETGLQINS